MSVLTKLLRDSYELQENQPQETAYWHLQKLREAIKTEQIKIEQEPLEVEIYGTCDDVEGEVYALFDNKKRCETEAEECGCEVKTITLYKGERV
jgi:hypothetical protein